MAAAVRELHERERARIRAEIASVPGLMALLMKPRNGQLWTAMERRELRARLRGMGRLGLYFAALAVPGTAVTLPILAWWLDRRMAPRVIVRRSDYQTANDTASD